MENQLVEALERFKGFKIVQGLARSGEYYACRDGLYIWDDGSLNEKATDGNLNCRGWFKNLYDLKSIINKKVKSNARNS